MEAGVFKLLNDAGVGLKVEARGYRPTMIIPGFDIKLLKPQNIVEMVNVGSRDIGFTGADLVEELGAKGLTSILDTLMDKVRLVAAAPEAILTPEGGIHMLL
jgi:ATP phosphoribosyltransferase